jgi:hypothetical protein
VEAIHFVPALHEYFAAKVSQQLATTDAPAENVNNTTLPPDTLADASWALEYIDVRRIQPLIDAIDGDGSSFITVNELNEFTSRRPKEWRRVLKITIYSSCLTYNQSPSLDRILDDWLRDDN